MTTTPIQPGTDRASEIEDVVVAIGEVSSAYYDLGETSIGEMVTPKGHEIVTRCRDTEKALLAMCTALAAECERMRAALAEAESASRSLLRAYDDDHISADRVGEQALEDLWAAWNFCDDELTPAPSAATSEEETE